MGVGKCCNKKRKDMIQKEDKRWNIQFRSESKSRKGETLIQKAAAYGQDLHKRCKLLMFCEKLRQVLRAVRVKIEQSDRFYCYKKKQTKGVSFREEEIRGERAYLSISGVLLI